MQPLRLAVLNIQGSDIEAPGEGIPQISEFIIKT